MVEGPGHIPMDQIEMNVPQAEGDLPRGAVLHARPARHRHRAGLRPHHERDRRGDDRLVRRRHALLRHAEGAPRPAERGGRAQGRDRLQDRRARRRHRARPPGRDAIATTRSPARATASTGTSSSGSRSIPSARASTTTRRCRPSTSRAPSSARCAGRSSARCT